jgi:hypothetical protein
VNEVIALSLMLVYSYLAPWWIIRRDMDRLPPEQLARCWNSASFGSAVVGFTPLCIVVHFIKAHGFLKGTLLGFVWAAAWTVGTSLLSLLLESLQFLIA